MTHALLLGDLAQVEDLRRRTVEERRQKSVEPAERRRIFQRLVEQFRAQTEAPHERHLRHLLQLRRVERLQIEMAAQDALMLVDDAAQIALDLAQMPQLLLVFRQEGTDIHLPRLHLAHARLHEVAVAAELLLRLIDRLHIVAQKPLVVADAVIEHVAADAQHRLANLLQLDLHEVENVLDVVERLVIALLLQMHLEDQFLNRQLQVALDFQRAQQKIIAVIRQMIRGSPHLSVDVDDAVRHIADMKLLESALLEVVAREVHGASLVGEDDVDDEVGERPAFVKRHVLAEMLCVDRIGKDSDIVHRAGFFLQRLLHDVEQYGKDHIHLLRQSLEAALLPQRLLAAVCEEQGVKPHRLHALGKSLEKIVPHRTKNPPDSESPAECSAPPPKSSSWRERPPPENMRKKRP